MSILVLKTGCDFIPPTSVPQEPKRSAPKLLDRLRLALETRRYRPETVGRFIEWNRQLILYHAKRHPETMGREEIEAFLGHLAQLGYGVELQAQARQALAFLYREVLGQVLPWPEIARARGGGAAGETGAAPPKLLDRVRAVLRARHYSLRTEECYVAWMRRYILFHNKRHPLEMGGRAAAGGRGSGRWQGQRQVAGAAAGGRGSSRWQQVERTKPCREALRISRCFHWLTSLP